MSGMGDDYSEFCRREREKQDQEDARRRREEEDRRRRDQQEADYRKEQMRQQAKWDARSGTSSPQHWTDPDYFKERDKESFWNPESAVNRKKRDDKRREEEKRRAPSNASPNYSSKQISPSRLKTPPAPTAKPPQSKGKASKLLGFLLFAAVAIAATNRLWLSSAQMVARDLDVSHFDSQRIITDPLWDDLTYRRKHAKYDHDVALIQVALSRLTPELTIAMGNDPKLFPGKIDGIYGPATRNSINTAVDAMNKLGKSLPVTYEDWLSIPNLDSLHQDKPGVLTNGKMLNVRLIAILEKRLNNAD